MSSVYGMSESDRLIMINNKVLLLLCLIIFSGCNHSDPSLDNLQLKLITLEGSLPTQVSVLHEWPHSLWPASESVQSKDLLGYANLQYVYGAGDSVSVTILEFSQDMAALGFQWNSGLIRENLPIVRGSFVERTLRAGRRVFVFRSSVFRPLPASIADQFVKSFPGYQVGLPLEFFALPLKNRLANGTSLQLANFWGTSTEIPMLIQRYGDLGGTWQCARSWSKVQPNQWQKLIGVLSQRGVVKNTDIGSIYCAWEGCMWLDQLPDGRVITVYGSLPVDRLTQVFMSAKKSLMQSEM